MMPQVTHMTDNRRRAKTTKLGGVSPEQRYRMVSEAAYYIAEKHRFQGDPVKFWLQAEKEIASRETGEV
jgi:hypothetical protein